MESPAGSLVSFSWGGLGTGFLGVLWSYHGWMNISPVAGEVKNPQRNIPLAFLAGVGIVIFLYLGANLAYYLVIPQQEMAQLTGTTVVAEFALRLVGPIGTVLASGVVMFSVFGALNGNILVLGRGCYLPWAKMAWLRRRSLPAIHHSRFHTPACCHCGSDRMVRSFHRLSWLPHSPRGQIHVRHLDRFRHVWRRDFRDAGCYHDLCF